jgi:hypothetical protein
MRGTIVVKVHTHSLGDLYGEYDAGPRSAHRQVSPRGRSSGG